MANAKFFENRYRFELKKVYKAQNGKRFKCVGITSRNVSFVPMKGFIPDNDKQFQEELRVNPANKRQCVNLGSAENPVWLSC